MEITVITVDGKRLTLLEWMRHPLYNAYQESRLISDPDRFVEIVEAVQKKLDVSPTKIAGYIDAFDDPGHEEWVATASVAEIGGWIIDGLWDWTEDDK